MRKIKEFHEIMKEKQTVVKKKSGYNYLFDIIYNLLIVFFLIRHVFCILKH